MSDALSNKLSSFNGANDENGTNSLADSFGQLSKEDLIKAIKQTLDLDTNDAYLSKTFDTILINIGGFTNDMADIFLQNVAGLTGVAPTSLISSVSDVFSKGITSDMAQKIIINSKNGLVLADKNKLANCLASCMNDPSFKNAFESANPGLLSMLGDKELLAKKLNNLKNLDDIKNVKKLLKGQGEFDQDAALDASMQNLMGNFIKDIDGLASEIIFKKAKEFESKINESHNSHDNKELLKDTPDDEPNEKIPDKNGPSIDLDLDAPKQLDYARSTNPLNAEELINEELIRNLDLALEVDELLVKGIKFNLVNPREVDDIKRDMVNMYADINDPSFIIVEGDSGREILDKMDKLVQSLSKWAVNSEFSEEAAAKMDWKHSNINALLNKYKIDDDAKSH